MLPPAKEDLISRMMISGIAPAWMTNPEFVPPIAAR
jgi:hypothetical protein